MTPLLQLTSITKSFGAVRALKDVSFDLRPGEVHALLGENGAGKSTLIKIITGAHPPDGGTLHLDGKALSHLSPARTHQLGITCIYQQPALFPDLTVAENIGLRLETSAAFRRVNWRDRRNRAAQLLQRIGAEISPDASVRSLSMPEQQLVEIACALGTNARIVIMDEPTASLTHKEVQLLFAIVRDLRASGTSIIYISHRLAEIFAMADRVTVLRDGQTVGTRLVRNTGTSNPTAALNESDLIQLMIGRELASDYAPTAKEPLPERAPISGAPVSDPAWDERPITGPGRKPALQPRIGGSARETREIVLSITNLCCTLGGVSNVSLDIRRGEIVGLAGLVGAGRSELARVLFGITPADRGEIRLHGERITVRTPQEAVAHGIAYVPEDRRRHGIILEMPIAANMTMAIHDRIFPGSWLRLDSEHEFASECIRNLDVKCQDSQAGAHTLSGGNQQKVALARWLATKPRVLILDEPTQGVDVGAKAGIHDIIRRLAGDGLAVLLISSDLPEVLALSDRIAVMRGGKLAAVLPRESDAQEVMETALGHKR